MLYNYKGYGGCDSVCDIVIHNNIVIATELEDNKGTSITNIAEGLATQVCKEFNIDPEKLIWVEHYFSSVALKQETFDIVEFTFLENGECVKPKWRRSTEAEFEKYKTIYKTSSNK